MSNIWQRFSSIAGITSGLVAVFINSAMAELPPLNIDQTISANTLPVNSQVAINNQNQSQLISSTGGSRSLNSVFHNFQQFSVPSETIAGFKNTNSSENIITKATSNSGFQINGFLKNQSTANLSLINTTGTLFGSNATSQTSSSCIGNNFISARINTETQSCPGCVCTCWDPVIRRWVNCPCPSW